MVPAHLIKISILANGGVLLDGQPATTSAISEALSGAEKGTAVWYYRENAAGEPSGAALQILNLIVANKLPVRLSAKPDFSDLAISKNPFAQPFASIRAKAAAGPIIVVRPDAKVMTLPAMDRATAPPQAIAAVEKLLPSTTKRNVAVLVDTSWAASAAPDLAAAARAIPYFGMLMGLGCIGHAVWLFQPDQLDMIAEGVRDADVILVDGQILPRLPAGWQEAARQSMRGTQILVHDRESFRLRKIPE